MPLDHGPEIRKQVAGAGGRNRSQRSRFSCCLLLRPAVWLLVAEAGVVAAVSFLLLSAAAS